VHLVYSDGAPLRLADCRLLAPQGSALIVCRRASQLELQDCQLVAWASAVCVEIGEAARIDVSLRGSTLDVRDPTGAALAVWAPEVRRSVVRLHLVGNTVQAGRVAALARLGGGVEVEAQENTFAFREALLSFVQLPAGLDWRQVVQWRGRNNGFHAPAADWLQSEGNPLPVRGLEAWRTLGNVQEQGSRELTSLPADLSAPAQVR